MVFLYSNILQQWWIRSWYTKHIRWSTLVGQELCCWGVPRLRFTVGTNYTSLTLQLDVSADRLQHNNISRPRNGQAGRLAASFFLLAGNEQTFVLQTLYKYEVCERLTKILRAIESTTAASLTVSCRMKEVYNNERVQQQHQQHSMFPSCCIYLVHHFIEWFL